MTRGRFAAGALLVSGLALAACASNAAPPPPAQSDLKAYVSIKELMENIIDPIADNIFDAVSSDISAKGVVDIKPTTDEDWAKIRIGAVTLAEGTNLLKIARPVAPPGDKNNSGGRMRRNCRPRRSRARSMATGRCGTSTRTSCATRH